MQLRTATATLALLVALAPAAAHAQSSSTGTTGGAAMTQGSATGVNQVGEAEATHAKRTMATGALSLLSSRIALEKAKDDDLKEFARFEVAEQEGIAAVLKSMSSDADATAATGSASAKPAVPSDRELEASLDPAGKEMVEKLRAAKAGASFDRMYLTGQMQGHQQLLQIQEDYLKAGRALDHRNVAILSSGQIREHIALLKDIREDMKED
jgi:putative membrane protein